MDEASVVFKVQGGHDVGMGHIYRSLALAATFTEAGYDVRGFACNDDRASHARIAANGYEVWPCDGSGHCDVGELVERVCDRAINVVIADQPPGDPALFARMKERAPTTLIVALDYFDLAEPNLDVIINLYNHNADLHGPTSPQLKYCEGPAFAIIRQAFDPFIAIEKDIRPEVRDILVSFGGSDFSGNTFSALQALQGAPLTNGHLHVVIGPCFRNRDLIQHVAEQVGVDCTVYEQPDHLPELMYRCDLGFTGGGTTMMEMAAVGTPAIVMPQTEKEERFARSFEEQGAVMGVRLTDRRACRGVGDVFEMHVVDQTTRQRISAAARRYIDGRGRYRVVEVVRAAHKSRSS